MAGPETDTVKQGPETIKAAAGTVPATKYVGTPAVGTSKAAAAGGIGRRGRDRPGRQQSEPATPATGVGVDNGVFVCMVYRFLPLLFAAHSF